LGIGRIGEQRDAGIGDLLPDLRSAGRAGEWAAPLVCLPRVKEEIQELHEITDRLRLEHHRVAPRLDRDGIA